MKKKPGAGQLDVILDGLDDQDLAVEYDLILGVQVIHRCEMCNHKISAEESQAFGIGYDCAAELGRRVWADRRAQKREAEVRHAVAEESGS